MTALAHRCRYCGIVLDGTESEVCLEAPDSHGHAPAVDDLALTAAELIAEHSGNVDYLEVRS